jgi:hypothetical protein
MKIGKCFCFIYAIHVRALNPLLTCFNISGTQSCIDDLELKVYMEDGTILTKSTKDYLKTSPVLQGCN